MYRVVIIDDSRADRTLAKMSLDASEHFVVVGMAKDGEEGIRLIDDVWPDVALVDLAMPVMDGFEVMHHVEEKVPGTRVVVMTGQDEDKVRERVHRLGGLGILQKDTLPLDSDALLALLEPEDIATA